MKFANKYPREKCISSDKFITMIEAFDLVVLVMGTGQEKCIRNTGFEETWVSSCVRLTRVRCVTAVQCQHTAIKPYGSQVFCSIIQILFI